MLYRFGDFTLDGATRQLLLQDEEVHLSPKAFDLLSFIIEQRSRAVSKAELQQQLWPTTFVEETNVAGLVAEIRRALRDSASDPRFLRTVYGFGYRFIGTSTIQRDPSPRGSTKLYLVFDQGERMLRDGDNVIGRGAEATVQIEAPSVSRRHARIVVAGGAAILEDIDSKNGTYLNGTRIHGTAPLSDGSEIKLGRVVLTFRIATSSTPTATVPATEV